MLSRNILSACMCMCKGRLELFLISHIFQKKTIYHRELYKFCFIPNKDLYMHERLDYLAFY